MPFPSTLAALAAYRGGRAEEAALAAAQLLARDPNAAEAHMCLALLALRRNDPAGLIEHLRGARRARSAEWILERLQADFHAMGFPTMSRDVALRLGGFLRSQLSNLGPVLTPAQRRADHAFVNVVGTSYVRSFGASTAFFPLFIGMGPTMLLLTETAAAVTQRKFAENLRRVDPNRDTLLVIGGDAYYHNTNLLKTRTHALGTPQPADLELIRAVARRHAPILADARKQLAGRIFLLGSTPTFSPFVDALALALNAELAPICAEHGVELIDCWAALADPATGHLRQDLSAGAYAGDIHYSLATAPIFIDALKAKGAFGPEVASRADFDWTGVYECDIDPSERTRIWCEPGVSPNNAFKSDKIAATHLNQRLTDLLTCLVTHVAGRTLAMVNVRDGGPAIFLPPQAHGGCLAFTDGEPNRQAAQMVLDFYGRTDVQLSTHGEEALQALAGSTFWGLVLSLHPDSQEADEARCNEVLGRIGGFENLLIATAAPDRLDRLNLGVRKPRNTIPISNRHIPEKWRDFTIFLVS